MLTHRSLFRFALVAVLGMPATLGFAAQQQTQGVASNAYAEVDEASARKLVKGCSLPREVSGPGASGSQIVVQFTVSEKGKLLGIHRVEGAFTHQLGADLVNCHFTPYKVGGTPTPFQANITIQVR